MPLTEERGGEDHAHLIPRNLYPLETRRSKTPFFSGKVEKTGEWRRGVGINDTRIPSPTPLSADHSPQRNRLALAQMALPIVELCVINPIPMN